MRILRLGMALIFISLFALTLHAESDIPVTITRISDRIIMLRLRHNPSGTNITAIKSGKGIVVIDTEMSYQIALHIREDIKEYFDSRDITYIVNTHDHWDHTNGNQAFRDAVIIGHENCATGIREFASGKVDFAEMYKENWIDYLKSTLESSELEPEKADQTRERIRYATMVYEELIEGYVPTLPTITFNDRLVLDLDDLTLNLIYFGRCHSRSDILIHIPEEKLLVVGDVCDGRSIVYIDENADVPRWLDILNELLEDESSIVHVVSGHGNMMTRQDFENHYRYIRELWEGVEVAISDGLSLEAVQARFSFESNFPYIQHLSHTWDDGTDYHVSNVETVWRMQSKDSLFFSLW